MGESFWESRRIVRDMVFDGTFEDAEMEAEGGVGLNDFARLLKDCNEFTFHELTEEQAQMMPNPQKIYKGPSGLRRNVATSFKTPLGSFRKAGFTLHMVQRWTENSNK
jgi:hypothetical protein